MLWGILFAGLSPLAPLSHAASDAGVRLGLLFNFIKYTEWPADTLGEGNAPLTICIAQGDDAMADGVAALGERTVHGHPIRTRVISTPEERDACDALYLPAALSRRLTDYLVDAGRPMLTVSDAADFADHGGMIGLIVKDDRYVFDINNDQIRQAGLRLPPQVLKLARRVR